MEKKALPAFETILERYPAELTAALEQLSRNCGPLYLSGGSVRDLLCGRTPNDLDITVDGSSRDCCHDLIAILGGGAYVELGTGREEAARCVWHSFTVDFSSFRHGAETIEEDLVLRDYTINALAVELFAADGIGRLLDPLHGAEDLEKRILRHCPDAFDNDPLRLLRGFRFLATLGELGFGFDAATTAEIGRKKELLHRSAAERIRYELDLMMATPFAAPVVEKMAECGILWQIFPELEAGLGMEQMGFHHKDVFGHSLQALEDIERIFASVTEYFPEAAETVEKYLHSDERRRLLRWAALLHDIGKPPRKRVDAETGKITFYNHDSAGRDIFLEIAARLRWSRADADVVAKLIEMHMQPFHLCTSDKTDGIGRKAFLRLYKKAGDHLPGLFVLAMADSLAGQGELKPEGVEADVAALYARTQDVVSNAILPVLTGERLIGGRDLIEKWHLKPGPLFAEILEGLETVQVEGLVTSYEEAAAWVDTFLAEASGQEDSASLVKE